MGNGFAGRSPAPEAEFSKRRKSSSCSEEGSLRICSNNASAVALMSKNVAFPPGNCNLWEQPCFSDALAAKWGSRQERTGSRGNERLSKFQADPFTVLRRLILSPLFPKMDYKSSPHL